MGIREILKNEIDNWVSEVCEKQIEKKPKDIKQDIDHKIGQCPICNCTVMYGNNYCASCGQKLDWEETE